MNTDMNKDQEMLDETRVMERLTDETTVIDMGKIRNEQNQTKKKDNKEESTIFSFFKEVFIALAVVLIIVNFVVRPIQVKGSSMYNTLEDGYFGVSDLIGYRLTGLKRFDIVIVYLAEKKEYLIKRVIGLPGETVEYRNNQLYINGEPVEEPFLDVSYTSTYHGTFTGDFKTEKLGEDEYFCMGDNRPHSSDSRYYGAFHKSDIVSKGVFIIYPFKAFGVYTW